jgi:hypothetical protein
MTDSDNYHRFTAHVDAISKSGNAFRIHMPDEMFRFHWLPFSVIHGGDERKIVAGFKGEIRIRRWKLLELGLITT